MADTYEEQIEYLRNEGFDLQVDGDSIRWTNPFEGPSEGDFLYVTHLFIDFDGPNHKLIDAFHNYIKENFRQCNECEQYVDIDDVFISIDEYDRDIDQDGVCFECLAGLAEANMDPYEFHGVKRSDF